MRRKRRKKRGVRRTKENGGSDAGGEGRIKEGGKNCTKEAEVHWLGACLGGGEGEEEEEEDEDEEHVWVEGKILRWWRSRKNIGGIDLGKV